MIMTSQLADMTSLSNFYVVATFLKFSEWYDFHVNIITGSGVMTIFFFKELTRNPETGYTPECCKMPGLQLLTFLSYQEKTNREWVVKSSHPPRYWLKT